MTRQRIVILGGDLSGAMAAAYLGLHLPRGRSEIIYVDNGPLVKAEWCMSSYSDLRQFNQKISLGEAEFAKTCAAGLKLGEDYRGWGPAPYINSFVDYGANIMGVNFIDLMLQQGTYKSLEDLIPYSLPVRAAKEGKFLPPDPKGRPIVSDFDYGYHFDPKAYADLLLEKAKSFGVQITTSKSVSNTADLIINATGEALENNTDSFIPWTGCNSYTVNMSAPQSERLKLTTDISAYAKGWTFRAFHQTQDTQISFFFDKDIGEQQHRCGRLTKPWSGNVLNIGFAAVCVEPLMGSPLRLMQHDIERLVKLFPPNMSDPIEREEYNRQTTSTYDRVWDYHSLQYATSTIWTREFPLTEKAAHKRNVFAARGRIVTYDEDMLFRDNWTTLFLGQGITPQRYDPFAEGLPSKDVNTQLIAIEKIITQALRSMPRHEDFIARQCAARDFAYK
ncbi:tryptophan 7-halogenase [Hellea balneolensis]|uniref:tryptophan 7-halogenase n=1 Tax=Hellea balneolensis TaxID=287478 RepID=UPI0004003004|nr:tryptophan 7-halogenase [Hellea balneolensis]